METNHEDRWVAGRLSALEPQWQPDYARGRQLLDAGIAGRVRGRSWRAAAALAAGLCIAALALPQTRAFAQALWYRLVLNRVDVVRLDLSELPLKVRVTTNGASEAVQDLDEAERKAGFRPDLPPPGVLGASPALSVVALIEMEQTIHVREMEAALRKWRASDVQAPAEWEGVQLRAAIGPMVAADYAEDVTVLQSRPIEMSVPAGFPLERFAEAAFRSVGVSWWEARALARKFVANPAWFLDIPPDEVANIQEVRLRAGTALLIEDFGDGGKVERVTVIRTTSERIYAVSAGNREVCLRVAEALP